jgi:MoaA/NifB/PqqE/SkfB family radical SAM enzyme/SAM-dependent methyltransferase
MSKTACIIPWTSLILGPDGRGLFCCQSPVPLTVDGRLGNIYRDSLDELWNAGEVVEVRAAMARGEKPAACRVCWEREAGGGVSPRLVANAAYRQMGGQLAVEALPLTGAGAGYRLERRPDWFILELGNVCNLKCRSCTPLSSSRIAADPIHAAWAATGQSPAAATATSPAAADSSTSPPVDSSAPPGTGTSAPARRRLQLVPENASPWFEDVDAMADMIASGAGGNAMLSLMGGEPFLIDHTWRLLDALVARGVAQRILVAVVSNGQQRSARLAELAPRFRSFNVSLSIDGHGKLYEYLRHGASWRKLVDNLHWLRQLPNLDLAVVPTLQNGNALDMVPLLRFLDAQELRLIYNVASWPARLHPADLPPSVRRIAVARLRAYLDAECRPENVAVVRGYCEVLEEAGDAFDADLFAEFMTFTNDLDAARGESLCEAAPELWALVRAAGIQWSHARRHVPAVPATPATPATPAGSTGSAGATAISTLASAAASGPARPATGVPAPTAVGSDPFMLTAELLPRVNRTISSRDVLFAGLEAVRPGAYISSGVHQLAEIDALLRQHGHPGLVGSRAVADFACYYGRMTRVLRAALPHAAVYACDIDREAVQFCAAELGALPVVTGWRPDEEPLPGGLDAVICVSLLTHTPLEHWRRVLSAGARMLRPGGVVAFTFLSPARIEPWLAGAMEYYGTYSRRRRAATARSLREQGFGFAALTSGYGGKPFYGIAFCEPEVVRREIAAAGLELLALPAEASATFATFAQELALARKPGVASAPRAAAPAMQRDVTVVALYDPRCYAPADGGGAGHSASVWARLAAADPPRALPTELGFGDPRVAEVREAQAALAREHGIDAFCYLYPWGAAGPSWDAPWRDLVASGRPDFPFCLMVAPEDREPISARAAGRLIDDIAAGLEGRRYLCVQGRRLLIVRDIASLLEPRAITGQWRAAAAARGLGELHLCAAEPAPADRPEDLGFDSFLQAPPAATDPAAVVAAALVRPWPAYRFFRAVECRRDAADPAAGELYEHWLSSAIDVTRRRGESLVFVDAWNDWLRGVYLEPDDHDGRAALLATRRAVRGPASGLVLLRRLRDALGEVGGTAAAALDELGQVLELHEHTRDRVLASVEAALGRNPPVGVDALGRSHASGPDPLRWVPVASRQLPRSGGGFCLDRVGTVAGPELHGAPEPISLPGDEVHLAGWAHCGACAPGEVDLFLALESSTGAGDRVFRVTERVARPDVAAALPGHPERCGFSTVVSLAGLPPGTYLVAIVQRTAHATYRDPTAVAVVRPGAPCSSA